MEITKEILLNIASGKTSYNVMELDICHMFLISILGKCLISTE